MISHPDIRWATDDDSRDEIATFVSRCFLASPVFAGIDERRYGPAPIRAKLERGTTFVARLGDRLVGSITVFPRDPESPCEPFRRHPQIGLLAVDPELAGSGIASALMRKVESSFAKGATIALSVTRRAPRLIAMYEAWGYEVQGEFHWPNASDGSVIMLRKPTRRPAVHERFPLTPEIAEASLNVIVGLPLTDMWRPAGQAFEFGEQRPFLNARGNPSTWADFSLTAYSDWRITRGPDIVMGSNDHTTKRRFYHRKTPPRDPVRRRHWRLANELFEALPTGRLVVRRLRVHPTGSLHLELAEGYEIDILRLSTDHGDLWRFRDDRSLCSYSAEPPDFHVFRDQTREESGE